METERKIARSEKPKRSPARGIGMLKSAARVFGLSSEIGVGETGSCTWNLLRINALFQGTNSVVFPGRRCWPTIVMKTQGLQNPTRVFSRVE